jgi:hypothetical protein
MSEEELKNLAEEIAKMIPRARWFDNKSVVSLITITIGLAFSVGVLWGKFQSFPTITKDQWRSVYTYSVVTREEREKSRNKELEALIVTDIHYDNRIKTLEVNNEKTEKSLSSISSILMSIEKRMH